MTTVIIKLGFLEVLNYSGTCSSEYNPEYLWLLDSLLTLHSYSINGSNPFHLCQLLGLIPSVYEFRLGGH